MSIENTVSINIDPAPLVSLIKTVIREESQPTLYGNDNSLAQLVQEEVEVSPRIHDRVVSIFKDYSEKGEFEDKVRDIVRCDISDLVRDNISYEDLASEIDASDIASYIRLSRLANEIKTGDIAAEISLNDIASELSIRDIAGEIDTEDLADVIVQQHIDLEDIANKIDYKKLATALLDAIAERSKPTTV